MAVLRAPGEMMKGKCGRDEKRSLRENEREEVWPYHDDGLA